MLRLNSVRYILGIMVKYIQLIYSSRLYILTLSVTGDVCGAAMFTDQYQYSSNAGYLLLWFFIGSILSSFLSSLLHLRFNFSYHKIAAILYSITSTFYVSIPCVGKYLEGDLMSASDVNDKSIIYLGSLIAFTM